MVWTAMKQPPFNKLTVGDPVLFYPRSALQPPEETTVEAVSRVRFRVKGVYFDRAKGYACGFARHPYPPAVAIVKKGAAAETNSPFRMVGGTAPALEDAPPRVILDRMLQELSELEKKIMAYADKIEKEQTTPPFETTTSPQPLPPEVAAMEAEASKQE
jgi:hypothetical protein